MTIVSWARAAKQFSHARKPLRSEVLTETRTVLIEPKYRTLEVVCSATDVVSGDEQVDGRGSLEARNDLPIRRPIPPPLNRYD
jgi:hypothetical protein